MGSDKSLVRVSALLTELEYLREWFEYCGTPRWSNRNGGGFAKGHSRAQQMAEQCAGQLGRILSGERAGPHVNALGRKRLKLWKKERKRRYGY